MFSSFTINLVFMKLFFHNYLYLETGREKTFVFDFANKVCNVRKQGERDEIRLNASIVEPRMCASFSI